MSHDKDAECHCRADHQPAPLEYEWHHIWPVGMGGPQTPTGQAGENGVWVCPTTHTNTHELLRRILRETPDLGFWPRWSYYDALAEYQVPVSRYAWRLAQTGYQAFVTGNPGAATLL